MNRKDFQLASDQLTATDHANCLHGCNKQTGDMLKCQVLNSVGKLPCNSIVHVSCVQSLEPAILPYLAKFYCSNCCTKDPNIQEEMIKFVNEARQALAKSKISPKDNIEIHKLQAAVRKLQSQLSTTAKQLEAQLVLNDSIQKRFEEMEAERNELKDKLVRSQSLPSTSEFKAESVTAKIDNQATIDSLLTDSTATILNAAQLNQQAELQQQRLNTLLNSSTISLNDINRDNLSLWPDYKAQEHKANEMSEMALTLLRSSIAKPLPFQGDVTTWALFLSDFKRTSARGHYREIEDMERLRELIKGQALSMFGTELSDPFAEPIKFLRRLDEFYGVRENAVRVSLDRVLALTKIDKMADINQLTSLYVNIKSYAHQCRANGKESELTSPAVLYIIESKLHQDQAKSWRLWVREQHEEESVDSVVSYLEERIRELHMAPQKGNFVDA